MFFRRKPRIPKEQLTVRILADVDDVDPEHGDVEGAEIGTDATLPPVRLVNWIFLPRIYAQLCLDSGDGSLQWLTEDEVAGWGASHAELLSFAVGNLNTKAGTAKLQGLKSEGGIVYTPICEGVTVSSLLLADRLFSYFGFAMEDMAAAIPNRDTYYFCDRRSHESMDLLNHVRDLGWDDEDCPRKYRITKSILIADESGPFGWAPIQGRTSH